MRHPPTLTLVFALVIACHAAGPPEAAPDPSEHSLSGLAAQHVAVLPTYAARVTPGLGWSVGRPADLQTTLDADIAAAFEERGLRTAWIFPDQLQQSYRHNATYATDPYKLAEEPLRSPSLALDARLPEPLASQIRTLVAFYPDTRLVLAPVELRLEPAGAGKGRGALKLVLVDARFSSVRWIGEIGSDTVSSFSPAISASIAARLAGIVAPQ